MYIFVRFDSMDNEKTQKAILELIKVKCCTIQTTMVRVSDEEAQVVYLNTGSGILDEHDGIAFIRDFCRGGFEEYLRIYGDDA